jgi:xanthosine utilization system XapX-like protein
VLVESSIVFRNVEIFVAVSFVASIYIAVARDIFALLNLNLPAPGSAAVVPVSKV